MIAKVWTVLFSKRAQLILACLRASPATILVGLSQDPKCPGAAFRECIARLSSVVRSVDPDTVHVADRDCQQVTGFELQFVHLVTASLNEDIRVRDQLLDWLLPADHIPGAVEILDKLTAAADQLGIARPEPPPALLPGPRGAAEPARLRPKLRLVVSNSPSTNEGGNAARVEPHG